jgi:tetratricopeptide (TPR) repeat protein
VKRAEFETALDHLDVARKMRPQQDAIWNVTLNALDETFDTPRSYAVIKKIENSSLGVVSKSNAYIRLTKILINQNENENALKLIKKSQKLMPNRDAGDRMSAKAHLRSGNVSKAEAGYRRALKINPTNAHSYYGLSQTYKFIYGDPLIAQMKELDAQLDQTNRSKSVLNFALGKAMDDIKNYDSAFAAYKTANDIARQFDPFDIADSREVIRALEKTHTKFDFSAMEPKGNPSKVPIFVTGLARSGTSLVEQIVSRHHDVESGGEAPWLERARARCLLAISDLDDTQMPRGLPTKQS